MIVIVLMVIDYSVSIECSSCVVCPQKLDFRKCVNQTLSEPLMFAC